MSVFKHHLPSAFGPAAVLLLSLSCMPAARAQTQVAPDNPVTNKTR